MRVAWPRPQPQVHEALLGDLGREDAGAEWVVLHVVWSLHSRLCLSPAALVCHCAPPHCVCSLHMRSDVLVSTAVSH